MENKELNINESQLQLLRDVLIDKTTYKYMQSALITAHSYIIHKNRRALSFFISSFRKESTIALDLNKKIELWNGYLTKLNNQLGTNYKCFKEKLDDSFLKDITKKIKGVKNGK